MEYSALTARRILQGTGAASASEIALAGKGFDVRFASASNPAGNLNFTEVDRMEQIIVSTDELRKFITDGRLNSP